VDPSAASSGTLDEHDSEAAAEADLGYTTHRLETRCATLQRDTKRLSKVRFRLICVGTVNELTHIYQILLLRITKLYG